ncbi:hypothetical protein CI1B_52380 [Bradyrhizobium ivorense]|uniref:Uncharacterized protein n=1 Tax=Bradyrhizobium ivorense TaxID=2511166 RepID=A0A508TJD2_9BRAD|nr:hypothetical protein CI1B_52380 [Bradyrhizobium ivorense]
MGIGAVGAELGKTECVFSEIFLDGGPQLTV